MLHPARRKVGRLSESMVAFFDSLVIPPGDGCPSWSAIDRFFLKSDELCRRRCHRDLILEDVGEYGPLDDIGYSQVSKYHNSTYYLDSRFLMVFVWNLMSRSWSLQSRDHLSIGCGLQFFLVDSQKDWRCQWSHIFLLKSREKMRKILKVLFWF